MKKHVIAVGMLLYASQGIASVPKSGKELMEIIPTPAQVCSTCHGLEGQGVEQLGPQIAGQPSGYISNQIKLFNAGHRKNITMTPMAATLQNDSDIKLVADYFSAKPAPKITPVLRGSLVSFKNAAEKLAYEGDWDRGIPACVTCHGASGLGVGVFPRLASQQESYLVTQLQAWQNGTRKGDPDGIMANVAQKLTPEEIAAIANYFANIK